MSYARRDYKDSVFRHLFGSEERKHAALELYNALAGTHHDDPAEIQITTIDNFIFLGRRNDVSFLVGDEMVLLEHQSTHNPNMPLRGLQYFERVYSKYIAANELDLYGGRLVDLPTPRFFVFYFGAASRPEREVLRLSDSFGAGPGDLEVTATVLNCNEGSNMAIMEACETLRGYAHLLALERENHRGGRMTTRDAIEAAIDQCIKDGYLVDYLTVHRAEVGEMLFTMEDEERAMRVHMKAVEREAAQKGFEEGEKAGFEQGEKAGFEQGEKAGFEQGEKAGFEQGEKAGFENGFENGEFKALNTAIANLMASANCDADTAMDMLGIPPEDRAKYVQ